ncbi:Branched-chain amino acid aminotransferase [Carnobacterium antarcticum]|nr:Branched-chain amino acid aminotransferase [Carnobacterium sp. CP1]
MMETVEQTSYFLNDQQMSTKELEVFQQLEGKSVYEVIRVQQRIPLFLEDHLERLRSSAASVGMPLTVSDDILWQRIYRLISLNDVENQNIKIIWNQKKEGVLLIFFTKSVYPPKESYVSGIHTSLLKLERQDPTIKLQRADYQQTVLKAREEKNAYEVLLVDQSDYVTEGSRSNLFIVKNGQLYTSPAKNVLLGIVRKKVLEICRTQGWKVVEEHLPAAQLDEIDGAFITGTGNNVLPIHTIDELVLRSTEDPIVLTLIQKFDDLVTRYIHKHTANQSY